MLACRHLYDIFTRTGAVNPDLRRLAQRELRAGRGQRGRGNGRPGGRGPERRGRPGARTGCRGGRMSSSGSTPRACCPRSRSSSAGPAATPRSQQCLLAGLRLTTPDEAAEISEIVRARTQRLDEADRLVLGYADWVTGLRRGIAAHHAGLLPAFKEVVEELFDGGPDPGRVRDRDTRARHQHAGPDAS